MSRSSSLRRVDVHAHFLPDFYRDALISAGLSQPDGIDKLPPWSEQEMIACMDALDIGRAYLSISSPGVHFGDDSAARRLARCVNEEGARLARCYPERIGFFASTPLPDVSAAIDEVQYAIDVLGAAGVVFETNFRGLYLGDASLAPLYEELDRRRAVLFLHPTSPAAPCGCAGSSIALGYPRPMIEFVFDTTRSVTNMVLSGTLDRYPNLRVIVPHAGATLPVLAGRIDLVGPALAAPGSPKPPSMREALRRLHFDLAGAPVPELLGALLNVADPNRIHYGSDWPFTPTAICRQLADALDSTPVLPEKLRMAVMRDNAALLFPDP